MLTKICFLLLLYTTCINGQEKTNLLGKHYQDNQENYIYMPMGTISFADSVVSYKIGNPKPVEKFRHPKKALGEPDYATYLKAKYVSLGCGGSIIVYFKDNGFIDLPGKDLYFFEVGPSVEAFDVSISKNGKKWIHVGPLGGGSSSIDIAEAKESVEGIFSYIKITDLHAFCPGQTPGADIDAIASVSSVLKLTLSGKILFDSGEFELENLFLKKLKSLANKLNQFKAATIYIDGHTDDVGDLSYNKRLSRQRAGQVKDKLIQMLPEKNNFTFKAKGYGEANPIASNSTEEGKQKNRRVEITVVPSLSYYKNRMRP